MFDFVRKHTRLALGFMLLLIIPSFIFFGVHNYTQSSGGGNDVMAKVDGQSISVNEFDNAQRRAVEQMRRQAPNLDAAAFDTPETRRETLDQLVRERVLLAAANQLHLFPSRERLVRLFDSDPQFANLRGPDGLISRDLLAAQGLTPEMFDQRLQQDFAVRQVVGGIMQTVPAPALAASAALDAFMQRRELQVQRFDPTAYRGKIMPTDAELDAYYKANETTFRAPEQATIEYVMLDLDTISKGIAISDADLHKAYDDNKARYTAPEERRASHILIKAEKDAPAAARAAAKAKAEALLTELRKNPQAFAELARKNSQDPGSAERGGDLDFFGRGAMVKPFEDTVFGLKVGELSGVVETDFGYHVMLLTAVRGGQVKPFDEVRGEIEAELRKTQAQRNWAAAAEQFTNTAYEQSDSLQPVIDKLKLQKNTATVLRTPAPGSKGPLASTKFLDAVFSADALRNKRNTDAVEVAPNQLIAARVLQYAPARTLPLAEVRDRARDRVVEQQAAALARKDGEARVAALRADTAGNDTTGMSPPTVVSRLQAQTVPKPILDAALQADTDKLPAVVGVDLQNQGYAVLRITRVLPRETPPAGDAPLRAQYAQAWAAAEADAYINALKKRFKADVKPAAEAQFAAAANAASAASGASTSASR